MSDLIDRQAAIDALMIDEEMLRRVLDDMNVVDAERNKYEWGLGLIESNIEDMKELPSAQPEQRKGKWIETHERTLFSNPDSITYVCSECGYRQYTLYGTPPITNFCPNCGADMRGET